MIFNIKDSYFYDVHENGNGGVICLNEIRGAKMYLEKSSFYNCSCNADGGAIYINCYYDDPGCILSFICSYKCFSTNSDISSLCSFARLRLGIYGIEYSSSLNYVYESTISLSKCSGSITIGLDFANEEIKSLNLTNNECLQYPLYLQPAENTNLNILYSVIVENKCDSTILLVDHKNLLEKYTN